MIPCAAVLLFACAAPAQESAAVPQLSLLTFAPGEVYWQRFGHNALLLRDERGAHVYNYGVFDFHQHHFFLNFARGHMRYRLVVEPLGRSLALYGAEGRWVYEQQLNLSREQRRAVRDFLEWNARPENAEYRYDYFVSNCSTRVRDVIDRALNGELRRQLEPQATSTSYRFDATRMMAPIPALMIGMDFLMGPGGDVPINVWERSFLPIELMEALRELRVHDAAGAEAALVSAEGWLRPDKGLAPPKRPPRLRMAFLALGLIVGAALIGLSRARTHPACRLLFSILAGALAVLAGVGGVVLLAAWTLTEHWAIWGNWNLLIASPLSLLLLPACICFARRDWNAGRAARIISPLIAAMALLALLLGIWAVQQHLHWVLLWLPIHLGVALGLRNKSAA